MRSSPTTASCRSSLITPDDARWGLLGVFESDIAVTLVYFLLFIACIAVLVGFRTRLAALVLFVCLASFQRRNPFVLNSGDQLLQVLAFFLVLMPAGVSLSVDRWLKRGDEFWEFPTRPIWPLRLVQLQVSILYISAVWAKVRGALERRDGGFLRVPDRGHRALPGPRFHHRLNPHREPPHVRDARG